MSQYNKTVLTNAGLELAKRANAGQTKFEITRAVTSADDWSNKTIQDIEAVTAIPNIMQQGTIRDTEEVESNNSVIGVSLCFANKNLSAGYQIKIIGVYAKEEGQDKDFLYAVTTAVTPEYMPDFSDGVLYRFNMQMYLVIGKAQAVNVVINDGASVTHGQFDKYKNEVTADLEKIENTHKEDMSHFVKSASINGGSEVLPDETGKLELVVPDPDLSKYVSLEQLTETLKTKADITAVPDKTDTEEGIRQAKAAAKAADDKAQSALDSKADKTDVYTKKAVDDAFNTRDSNITNAANLAKQAQETANTKANASDVYTKTETDNLHNNLQTQINANDKGTITTGYDWNTGTPTNESRSLQSAWIVDQLALRGAVDRMNSINSNANGRLSLGGGNMNLRSTINWNGGEINDKTGNLGGLNWAGGSDWAKIYGDQDDNDNLDLAIDLGDDGSNHVSFRKNGSETSAITSDGHFTGTVDWGHVNGRPQDQVDRVNTITPLFRQIQNSNNWKDIFGVDNPNNVLTSLRINPGGSGPLINDFAAGIGFGGGDTKGVLSVNYSDHLARITGGNGTGPTWSEDIAWKSDVNDLRNQIQQLRENQFETQTFTDATAAANWEAQRPGHRLAIVNS